MKTARYDRASVNARQLACNAARDISVSVYAATLAAMREAELSGRCAGVEWGDLRYDDFTLLPARIEPGKA